MKAAYTIHELIVKGERVAPKTVIELSDDAFAELDAMGAVRAAEKDEIAIAGLAVAEAPVAETKAVSPVKPAPKSAADKRAEKAARETEAAAAEKAAKEAEAAAAAKVVESGNQTVDPDETESDLLGGK